MTKMKKRGIKEEFCKINVSTVLSRSLMAFEKYCVSLYIYLYKHLFILPVLHWIYVYLCNNFKCSPCSRNDIDAFIVDRTVPKKLITVHHNRVYITPHVLLLLKLTTFIAIARWDMKGDVVKMKQTNVWVFPVKITARA